MNHESRKIISNYLPGMLTCRQAANMMGVSVRYVKRLRMLGLLRTAMLIHDELILLEEADVRAYQQAHAHLGTRRKKPLTS